MGQGKLVVGGTLFFTFLYMSWFKRLFGKCGDDCDSCCGDEKQETSTPDPVDEPVTEGEEQAGEGETPIME